LVFGRIVKELTWAIPFGTVGLLILVLLRPAPLLAPPAEARVVADAEGMNVSVRSPLSGEVQTWCSYGASAWIENTRSPGELLNGGNARARESFAKSIWGWMFPEVVTNESLWTGQGAAFEGGLRGHYANIEIVFGFNAGAYLGGCGRNGLVPMMRSIGLPAVAITGPSRNWDESMFTTARVEAELVAMPERAEALIESYKRAFGALMQELQPETLARRPRILIMASSSRDWHRLYVKNERNAYQIYLPPAGVTNAADRNVPQSPDAERIIGTEPDIIFLMGYAQTPKEFEQDLRWRGLRAVREKHVYRMPGEPNGGGGLAGLNFQPLWTRWMAELAHPARLQPQVRSLLREHFVNEFGYRLSDDQIDQMLHIDVNKDQPGYERFNGDYKP
jgi:hypothetical protein